MERAMYTGGSRTMGVRNGVVVGAEVGTWLTVAEGVVLCETCASGTMGD